MTDEKPTTGTCRICEKDIEDGDTIIHIYDMEETGGVIMEKQMPGLGQPYVHLECVIGNND